MKMMQLYETLFAVYGAQHWWPANTPFEMMTGAVLTQNTSWENVKRALALFDDKLSPEFIETCALEELYTLIFPSGFYRAKAGYLKNLTAWYKTYGYDIERVKEQDIYVLRNELLSVKGVGRETADSILLYALDKPIFVVDAYTRRLFGRCGLIKERQAPYDEIRAQIEKTLKKDERLFNEFHALIVYHAKTICKAKPDCKDCINNTLCKHLFTEKEKKLYAL